MSASARVVCTSARLPCNAQQAWEKVCFYEHISTKPSWLLRTILPVPLRTTGCYRNVGDVSRCMYSDGGFLAKKITRIVAGERIEFDIVEHTIRYCRRIILQGGSIQIEAHEDGTSAVRMVTRYTLRLPGFVIAAPFIDWGVSTMHKVVIRDMQYQLARRPSILVHTV